MAANERRVGAINVAITASTQKFVKGLKNARSMLANFRSAVISTAKKVTAFGVALTGAVTAIGIKFTIDAAKRIDALAKASDKLGISTEALAGLQLAAEETGVSFSTLEMALQRMVRRVAEAAQGVGEARGALSELGLDPRRLTRLTPDKQFLAIAAAMQKVRHQSDRVRIGFKLVDSEGVDLIRTMALGERGLAEAAQAARDLGLAVDRESARGVERALDAWGRFKKAIQGVANELTISLMPLLGEAANRMTRFLSEPGRIQAFGQKVSGFIIRGFARIFDTLQLAAIGLERAALQVQQYMINMGIFFKGLTFSDNLGSLLSQQTRLDAAFARHRQRVQTFSGFSQRAEDFLKEIADNTRNQRNVNLNATDLGAR